ncbi:MAG: hypothetical protein AB8I08_35025 [Sandaracinaceae bacterium]
MKPNAWRLIAAAPGRVAVHALLLLPASLAGSLCLIGALGLVASAAHLVPAFLRDARRRRGSRGEGRVVDPVEVVYRTGVFALGVFAALVAGWGAIVVSSMSALEAISALPSSLRLVFGFAFWLLGGAVSGAALAPFAFTPAAVATGAEGIVAPFLSSFATASRVGFGRLARLGAQLGLAFGVCLLVPANLAEHVHPGFAVLGVFAVSGWMVWALASTADLHVQAEVDAPRRATAARGLGALVMVVAPVLVLLAGAMVGAVFTPTKLTDTDGVPGWGRGMPPRGVLYGPELRLPGTSIRARAVPGGVDISAPDGGGAGFVRSRWGESYEPTLVLVAEHEGGPFYLYLTDGMSWQVTRLDAEGVRLDDGLTARTVSRLGVTGLLSLGVAALLFLVLLWLVGSRLGEARTLAAAQVDTLTEMRPGGPLQALEGRLRVSDDNAVMRMMQRGRLQVRGDAWIDALGGELRLRLPGGVLRVLGAAGEGELDDAVVTVLSRFDAIRVAGFRSGPSPWPRDAQLVFGTIDDAGAALVARTVRTAAMVALPLIAACLTAAALMISSVAF